MKKKNRFWGFLFIAIALFLIASQFGLITADIGIWSILLGGFFGGMLIKGILDLSISGTIFPVAFLWMIFDKPLGLPDISNWTIFLIAVLLSIGCSFLFPKHHKHHNHNENWKDYEDADKVGEYQTVVEENDGNHVYCENRFGATTKYIKAMDLKNADLNCSFGELKVYFDEAVIQTEPVDIKVNVSFGHMELYLPRAWKVIHEVNAFAGSVDEKNRNESTGSPRVNLVGDVSFGEITIIYI